MKRILPDEVLAAYAKTGLKPMRGSHISRDGDCACALGAMACAAGERRIVQDCVRWSIANLDIGYRIGFIAGFDGVKDWVPETDEIFGHADGQACAAAVFAEEQA